MVQIVFLLLFYILQICAAVVTMFLSLHVKFIWFQVVLMHDIGVGVDAINLVELGSRLFEVTKKFRNFAEEEICLVNVPWWSFKEARTQARNA